MMPPQDQDQDQDPWPRPPRTRTDGQVRLAGAVLLALREVAPAAVLATLAELLTRELGAEQMQLYLTDYQLIELQLIDASGSAQDQHPQHVRDSPAGQVFLTQEPSVEPAPNDFRQVMVPVSVRGQRLGVLCARLPGDGRPEQLLQRVEGLRVVADVLAHVVVEVAAASDVFEVTRRSSRFTVAAELQRQLLPGRAIHTPAFTVAGQVEPAPYVQGDAFDWSADPGALTLCALHVSGRGQSAALLATLTVTALRNARRAEIPLVDQARLADQAVYAEYGGQRHASALLMRIGPDGHADVVDAGSPALLRWRNGSAERVQLDAQLPLGMFEDSPYVAQDVQLCPGDRLLIATPGALHAVSPDGQAFGEDGLLRHLELTRALPPQEVTRHLIDALVAHQGEALASDASVLCLDWRGV